MAGRCICSCTRTWRRTGRWCTRSPTARPHGPRAGHGSGHSATTPNREWPHDRRSRCARPVVHDRRAQGFSRGRAARAAAQHRSRRCADRRRRSLSRPRVEAVTHRTDYGHLWVSLGTPARDPFALPEWDEPDRRAVYVRSGRGARVGAAAGREFPRPRALPLRAHRDPRDGVASGGREVRGRAAARRRRALGDQVRVLPAQGGGRRRKAGRSASTCTGWSRRST